MLSDSSQVKYHWLADGTKYRVADASGNGVIYAGDLTFTVVVSGGNTTYALERAEASVDGTARFLKNGTAMPPYYTIRDHIGSVRTIVNASGTVVERNDYSPFGSRTTFGASYATLSSNRKKFSGKEDQTAVAGSTLPYLDFGARMYDAKLVRWNTYDPMAEKYYGINPYVYCNGDPMNMVDKRGLFMDNFIFEKGRYKERVPVPNEPHKLIVINNEETIEATFADPDNDPSSITNNTRVHIVSNEDISNIIKQSGAYNEDNHGLIAGIRYLKNESVANKLTGGKLDFTGSEEYYIDPDDLYITQTKGEGAIAHNGYNYGNFLWGASASALGVPLLIVKIGAHYYNFFLDPSTKWTLDSKDDQFSISVGYHWQNENK